uniref:DB domain-containing protein n=1 Tax=Angiostrongylus cantonensis TaxID=6313 RepID=A0A0K0DGM7_ANGCA
LSNPVVKICLVRLLDDPSSIVCAVSGVCGVQPYCASYAPPVQPCQCVSAAYACGRYGCYRARVRGSKSFQPNRFRSRARTDDSAIEQDRRTLQERLERTNVRRNEPMSESEELAIVSPSIAENRRKRGPVNPNRAFFECCMDRQLPDACLAKCNFRSYTREALTSMYFKQDPCPMEAMSEMQFCAAQGRDHAECCARNGVTTTLAGMKCLTLCDQRLGHPIRLDMSYVPCLDRFENMKACFWHDMTQFYRQ